MTDPNFRFTRLTAGPKSKFENIPIDYAVIEHALNFSVMPYSGSWSDLGDWQAMWREGEADGNGIVTSGPSTPLDCKKMLLHSTTTTQELVAMGLEDIIAMALRDVVLLAHKDRAVRQVCCV